MTRIIYPLPALPRNGGIKVCLQHSHLLNETGLDCYVAIPKLESSPYPSYSSARIITWDECFSRTSPKDIFVFCWAADIPHFQHLKNRFIFFSQGVINKSDPVTYQTWLNPRFELWSIGKHSRDFFYYGYGRDSRIVNNWIREDIFYPDLEKQDPHRVGMMAHRNHFDPALEEVISKRNLTCVPISGTEQEVAKQMQSCAYFMACSKGIYNGHDFAEGFPLPGAEAMATGALLISYNNHGCLEYAFDRVNSLIAWKNTQEDLIAKLDEAVRLPEAVTIRSNSSFSIRQRFNRTRVLNQLLDALELQTGEVV